MKVAILTTDSREAFPEMGIDYPNFGTAPRALFQGFESIPGLEIHVVSCLQKTFSSPDKLADNIWFHPLIVSKIGWLKTGYQGCIRSVRKKLQEIQPDIVHGQGTERDCSISAVFSGFPNVLTIHGNMRLVSEINRSKPMSFNWLAALIESFTIPRSDGIVCITNYTRDAVRTLAKKTWVLPNAVDDSFFEIKPASGLSPKLLFVGAVCLRKNQNDFIRAMDGLAQTEKFEILFLGLNASGSYGEEFLRLVEARPWCKYIGYIGREELKTYFMEAGGLVLPSREDNCPMVVLEAMAAGVPVAAAEVGGIPDLIHDGINGFLMNPLDGESMRRAVLNILRRGQTSAVSGQARNQALVSYHPGVVAAKHVEIYQEVIDGKAKT